MENKKEEFTLRMLDEALEMAKNHPGLVELDNKKEIFKIVKKIAGNIKQHA